MQDTESAVQTVRQVNGFVRAVDSDIGTFCDAGSANFLSKAGLADLNALIKETVSEQQWILWTGREAKTS